MMVDLVSVNTRLCCVSAVLVLFHCPPVLSAESSLEVETDYRVSVDIKDARVSQLQATISPTLKTALTDSISMTVSGRLRADERDLLDPGHPTIGGYIAPSKPLLIDDYATLELRDAYLRFAGERLFLTLGKQQIIWGELEGFKLLDVVNPQSFREFILDDFDESRIGLWSASLEYVFPSSALGDWSAQIVWAPDTSVHEIPTEGAIFEFRSPRFRFGIPKTPGVSVPLRTELRNDIIEASGAGMRLVGLVGGWDLSAQIYSGTDPEPLGRFDVAISGIELVRFHRRRTMIGASAARTFGGITLRTEVGFQPNRYFVTRDTSGILGETSSDQLGVALVADFFLPGDVFVSAQVFYDRVLQHRGDFVRPQKDVLTSAFIRRSFRDDRLFATVRWYASDSGSDGVVRPEIRFDISDEVSMHIGADLFYGDSVGILGQFDENDRVTLRFSGNF